jgi:hypothetical protein
MVAAGQDADPSIFSFTICTQKMKPIGPNWQRSEFKPLAAIHVSLLALIVQAGLLTTPKAHGCTDTPFWDSKVGDNLSTLWPPQLCAGRHVVQLRPYTGVYGEGLVICVRENRDTRGRRLLVISDKVVAIRYGDGMTGQCSWGRSLDGD